MDLRTAQEQIARLKFHACFTPMEEASKKYSLPLEFVIAIASRETDCENLLGDYSEGVYHETGVMQVGIEHEISLMAQVNRNWRSDPGPLIDFACGLLRDNLNKCGDLYPDMVAVDRLRFAAAAYHSGIDSAVHGEEYGTFTSISTGHTYGSDVIDRMNWFAMAIQAGPRPKRTVPTK